MTLSIGNNSLLEEHFALIFTSFCILLCCLILRPRQQTHTIIHTQRDLQRCWCCNAAAVCLDCNVKGPHCVAHTSNQCKNFALRKKQLTLSGH